MRRDTRAAFAVLARADLLQARAAARIALRDPVFVAGALALAVAVGLAAAQIGRVAARSPDEALPMIVLAAALAFAVVHASFRRGSADGVETGPFGDLVRRRPVLAVWLAARAAACLAPLVLLCVAGALAAGPGAALLVLACAVAGIAAAAAMHVTAGMRTPRRRDRRAASQSDIRPQPAAAALPPPALVAWVHLRRRAAGVPIWLSTAALFVLAGLAGGLARQNSGADVGAMVTFAAAIPALALIGRLDGSLVETLGREPIGLARLLGWFCALAVAAGAGAAGAALVAGLGPGAAAAFAAACGLGLGLYGMFLILHALVRSPAVAPTGAGIDLAVGLVLPVIGTWAAIGWPIMRLALLVRAAARRRWLDR